MKKHNFLIQPLLFASVDTTNNQTALISKPSAILLSSFEINKPKAKKLEITFIPSPYNEWIIGYNTTNKKSEFICVGAVKKPTTIKINSYEHYLCARFDENAAYFAKGLPENTYPVNMLEQVFSYTPEADSFESKLILSLKECKTIGDMADAFSKFLASSKGTYKIPELVHNMTNDIKESCGSLTVYELSERYGYSVRHIARLFTSVYGFSPKDYCKYIRFQCTLAEIKNNPNRENSEFIKNLGYSDQAHFQREFKFFTGITPKQFTKNL